MGSVPAPRPQYSHEQILQYFNRIGAPDDLRNRQDLISLRRLQAHHLAAIPFENTLLHYSRDHVVSLDADDLFEKIVVRGRGGYCMEVNYLFGLVLRGLGYDAYSVGARVNPDKSTINYDSWSHMVNLVTIEGQKFMVDVGFGLGAATKPLPLQHGYEEGGVEPLTMRIKYENIINNADPRQRLWIYERQNTPQDPWQQVICFSELEFLPGDFAMMNFWTSQSETSFFKKHILLAKYVMENETLIGILTMMDGEFKRRVGPHPETSTMCRTEEERVNILRAAFGLDLTEEEEEGIRGLVTELHGS